MIERALTTIQKPLLPLFSALNGLIIAFHAVTALPSYAWTALPSNIAANWSMWNRHEHSTSI